MNFEWLGDSIRRMAKSEGTWHGGSTSFTEDRFLQVVVVEAWLSKRRSLRTRWSKKAENWLALVQLACAHILLNLAVFG